MELFTILMANRNWCDLPQDVLGVICKKLPDIYDFTVFHAVCKDWRSCKCDPPLQLPWIVEHGGNIDSPTLRFYSLSSSKIHTITCARSSGKYFFGPCHHYLLGHKYDYTDDHSLFFLNPLTNNEIPLPHEIQTVEWTGVDSSGHGEPLCFSNRGMTSLYNPSMIFWRCEDEEDNSLMELQGFNSSTGMLYHQGEFFSVNEFTGITKVMDITTKKFVYELPPVAPFDSKYYNIWMVEAGGEILQLRKELNSEGFSIHRLDLKNGKQRASWVKVNSIGEYLLFLDKYRGLSFCTRDYKGLGENCIYFIEDSLLYKYDIKDGTVENLYCPFVGNYIAWFTPRPY